MRVYVRPLTLSNMNISATSRPIGMKFYLKHYLDGGKDSVAFDLDWIRTLVSMATHNVMMGKITSLCFLDFFYQILFILAGNDDMHENLDEFEICQIRPRTTELAALELMKKNPIDI